MRSVKWNIRQGARGRGGGAGRGAGVIKLERGEGGMYNDIEDCDMYIKVKLNR